MKRIKVTQRTKNGKVTFLTRPYNKKVKIVFIEATNG